MAKEDSEPERLIYPVLKSFLSPNEINKFYHSNVCWHSTEYQTSALFFLAIL